MRHLDFELLYSFVRVCVLLDFAVFLLLFIFSYCFRLFPVSYFLSLFLALVSFLFLKSCERDAAVETTSFFQLLSYLV